MSFYERVAIEEMAFDEDAGLFTYSCPCGDLFTFSMEQLMDGETIAHCPSCSLKLYVEYDIDDFFSDEEEDLLVPQQVLVH